MTDAALIRPLLELFRQRYGDAAAATGDLCAVLAPGRVNLIGEHTDYNGYPVLPVALRQVVAIVFQPRSDHRFVVSSSDGRFPEHSFDLAEATLPYAQGDWGNYVKAAVAGLIACAGVAAQSARGYSAVVGGNLPVASGLSSSSALLTAVALAFLHASAVDVPPLELAGMLARSEHFVGTEGGGMDQAAALLARERHALRIDFFPLRAAAVAVPERFRFVVCNSLLPVRKSGDARMRYNQRVAACRLAAALIARVLLERHSIVCASLRLADIAATAAALPAGEFDRAVDAVLVADARSLDEIAQALGPGGAERVAACCSAGDGTRIPEPAGGFPLRRRYRHVIEEAQRVREAVAALREDDADRFGALMNASHASCRDLYDISCEELEAMVALARRHGALGARLTGAGFGGCTVNLLPADGVDAFLAGMQRDYFGTYLEERRCSHPDIQPCDDAAMFLCEPAGAARLARDPERLCGMSPLRPDTTEPAWN